MFSDKSKFPRLVYAEYHRHMCTKIVANKSNSARGKDYKNNVNDDDDGQRQMPCDGNSSIQVS